MKLHWEGSAPAACPASLFQPCYCMLDFRCTLQSSRISEYLKLHLRKFKDFLMITSLKKIKKVKVKHSAFLGIALLNRFLLMKHFPQMWQVWDLVFSKGILYILMRWHTIWILSLIYFPHLWQRRPKFTCLWLIWFQLG